MNLPSVAMTIINLTAGSLFIINRRLVRGPLVLFLLFCVLLGMSACQSYEVVKSSDFSDLESLPTDTGGKHSASSLGETDAPYGFYIYIPAGYEQGLENYPALIFLHGIGERGNSSEDIGKLDLVLKYGPPQLIETGKWSPAYPMIVVSPQCHDEYWQPKKIDQLIRYITKNYRVDQSRIYLTGLSMGGAGVYWYLTDMSTRSLAAAAVAICGEGNAADAEKAKVPIWAFHGEVDDTIPLQRSIEMIEGLVNVPEAKLTVYPNVGHNAWDMTYDLSGMGQESEEYDPFDISIYDWLFTYSMVEE
jgi:predicted peptidase